MSSMGRRSSMANSKVPVSQTMTSETACSICWAITCRSPSASMEPEDMRIWPSDRRSRSSFCERMAWSRMPRSIIPEETSRSPSLGVRGAWAETSRPPWKPIIARSLARESSSVPVRRPRWMNCITSATETSLRLPEIPTLLPARQLDQALQRAELAVLGGEEPRGEHGRGGVGGEEVEQVPVLGPQNRLVIEQLQHHQRAHDVVLHPQRHRRERLRLRRGAQTQHAVLERLVDHRVAPPVGLAVVERQDAVVHPLQQGDLVPLPLLVAAQQQHELVGAQEVDGDLGDRRLHLGRIERGVELVGGDIEVHQPAALVLGVDQAGGELLDVRLGGGEPALQLGDALVRARALAPLRGATQVRPDPTYPLPRALQRRAQLADEVEPHGRRLQPRLRAAGRAPLAQVAEPFASRRWITSTISSLWNGFLI